LLFNGTVAKKKDDSLNDGPKIFAKLIRDKLEKQDKLSQMSQRELCKLMAHFVLFHCQPIANQAKHSFETKKADLLHTLLIERINPNDTSINQSDL